MFCFHLKRGRRFSVSFISVSTLLRGLCGSIIFEKVVNVSTLELMQPHQEVFA